MDKHILWVVDELVAIFPFCDVQEIMEDFDGAVWSKDPIIHFYEDFLAEFDKVTRKDRGIWYIPQPVVSSMVRARVHGRSMWVHL